jgi:hypothetical protein
MSLETRLLAWWDRRRPAAKSAVGFGAIYLGFFLFCWAGILILHSEASILFVMPLAFINTPWYIITGAPFGGGTLFGLLITDVVIPTLGWAGVGGGFGLLFEFLHRRFAVPPQTREPQNH